MSMRTPLGKVLGLGSAHGGTDHFWRQRLTSVANVPLTVFFVFFVIISSLVHMRIGMQVIIEDYVHGEFAKIVLLMLNTFFTLVVGGLCLFAVLKLGFGG